jgi:hypothetical protein
MMPPIMTPGAANPWKATTLLINSSRVYAPNRSTGGTPGSFNLHLIPLIFCLSTVFNLFQLRGSRAHNMATSMPWEVFEEAFDGVNDTLAPEKASINIGVFF